MALVAYEYSSGSDNEITTDEGKDYGNCKVTPIESAPKKKTSNSVVAGEYESESSSSGLFANLPDYKVAASVISKENDKLEDFIPTIKTTRKKVQISIPSLSDFDDHDTKEKAPKKIKASSAGSGLLGILPPVQGTPLSNTSFVPNTVKSKNIPTRAASTSKGLVPHSVCKNLTPKKFIPKKIKHNSDSETDDEDVPIPETFDPEMWEKVCGRPKVPKTIQKDKRPMPEPETEITIAPEPEKPYEGLNNMAFKELVGKTKRPLGKIKLIDINEEEILPDKDLWMTKSLTDPDMAPRTQIENPVDPTRKRKHHITYLAEQAKANEQELKAAWATSKNNRMMSRAKYGF